MKAIYSCADFSSLAQMRISTGLPIDLYWMRAIDNSEVAVYQTQKEHRHSFFELHFVLSGEMRYRIKGETVAVKNGQLLLIPPAELHRVSDYSADFLKFSVAFSMPREEELYDALYKVSGQALALSDGMRESLDRCFDESRRDTVYSPLIIRSRFFEILYALSGFHEKKRTVRESGKADIRLIKAKQFIEDNAHTFLGCEDVAGYCYISVKQLNRIFMRYENMTLLAYIHREKIASAEKLLRDDRYSLQEISDLLGFSSVYYFHAFFSRHAGVAPGEYRKNIGSENGNG